MAFLALGLAPYSVKETQGASIPPGTWLGSAYLRVVANAVQSKLQNVMYLIELAKHLYHPGLTCLCQGLEL
jgi:hypothetical protein